MLFLGKPGSKKPVRYMSDSRVHDLHHTFAVLFLQNGDSVKTAQGNLGHATAAFTLDVYGHVSEKTEEDCAARMEGYIKGILNL